MVVITRSGNTPPLGEKDSSHSSDESNHVVERQEMSPSSRFSSQSQYVNVEAPSIEIKETNRRLDVLMSQFEALMMDVGSSPKRDVPIDLNNQPTARQDELPADDDVDGSTYGTVNDRLGDVARIVAIPINPPVFLGERTKAREWLREYNATMDINGFSDHQKLRRAHSYLQKKAKNWHIVLMDRYSNMDWKTYKEFINRFCGPDDFIQIREQLDSAYQIQGQEPSDFAEYVLNLCIQLDPKMHELEKVRRVIMGLNPSIRNVLIINKSMEEWTLEVLMKVLNAYESSE